MRSRLGESNPDLRIYDADIAPEPSGIDYLKLIDTAHTQQLESRINYTALFGHTDGHTDGDTDGDTDGGGEPTEAAQ